MASREDEPNSKERAAYYKAIFYLNLELEDEIKARKKESPAIAGNFAVSLEKSAFVPYNKIHIILDD